MSKDNSEAVFFLWLNGWLLLQSGGAWDYPEPIDSLIKDEENFLFLTDCLSDQLKALRAASFLGIGNFLRYPSIGNLDIPWGWKDPRNTFTLPFWLKLFPQAKVIHISRHGVDWTRPDAHR